MIVKAALSRFFDDRVIYRDLNAVDARLPRFADARDEMGLASPRPPRKLDKSYAQVLAWLLQKAQQARRAEELREIVYIGDTMLSDGGAFANLREFTGWRGWCFIGAERGEELTVSEKDGLYQANRWSAVAEFVEWLERQQAARLDQHTAVIVDIDKTLLGARGRNDGAIDRARVAAIEATVEAAVGPAFAQAEFRRSYSTLNTPQYHSFTADNQDNVAYVCLMLSAGVVSLESLLQDIAAGVLVDYRAFMHRIDAERGRLPNPELASLHDDIYANVLSGDLTPFKAFRRREYVETVARMGHLSEGAPLARRLVEEICLTQEVWDATAWLKQRGGLMVALSDKPMEATSPTAELSALGYEPLHRTATHIIGQSVSALLAL